MKSKALKDLKDYVIKVKFSLQDICKAASHKRKTTKWKACLIICKILLLRIESTHGVLTTWGDSDDMAIGDETFLHNLYGPVIAYWQSELNK